MEKMEENRYARQAALPEIGPEGQRRLREASVLVVGVGGLGGPAALSLAGAGVGRIGLVDDDVVSLTNLHRQVLYDETEAVAGMAKVQAAARRLLTLNSNVRCCPHKVRLTPDNADEILTGYDIVVDGCDNYATRYLIDEWTAKHRVPYVYGAVAGFEGQVSVFNAGFPPRRYRELYPTEPEGVPERRVVGMVTAVVGAVQAHEVLKLACGYGETLAGRLWTVNLLTMQSHVLDF